MTVHESKVLIGIFLALIFNITLFSINILHTLVIIVILIKNQIQNISNQ